jgi:hypothetical protein
MEWRVIIRCSYKSFAGEARQLKAEHFRFWRNRFPMFTGPSGGLLI